MKRNRISDRYLIAALPVVKLANCRDDTFNTAVVAAVHAADSAYHHSAPSSLDRPGKILLHASIRMPGLFVVIGCVLVRVFKADASVRVMLALGLMVAS